MEYTQFLFQNKLRQKYEIQCGLATFYCLWSFFFFECLYPKQKILHLYAVKVIKYTTLRSTFLKEKRSERKNTKKRCASRRSFSHSRFPIFFPLCVSATTCQYTPFNSYWCVYLWCIWEFDPRCLLWLLSENFPFIRMCVCCTLVFDPLSRGGWRSRRPRFHWEKFQEKHWRGTNN